MNEDIRRSAQAIADENSNAQFYVLDDKRMPVAATKEEWTKFIATGKHIILAEQIGSMKIVSLFVGVHDKSGNIFGLHVEAPLVGRTNFRFKTWAEAERAHVLLVNETVENLGKLGVSIKREK